MEFFNLFFVLLSICNLLLQLTHTFILSVSLCSCSFSLSKLFIELISEFGECLLISCVSIFEQFTKLLGLVKSHFIFIVLCHLSSEIVIECSDLSLKILLSFLCSLELRVSFMLFLLKFCRILLHLFIHLLSLVCNCVNLTIENELLTDNVELLLLQILLLFVKGSAHLSIFGLE